MKIKRLFVLNKLYPIIEPLENDPNKYLRVVDESGEDYLYPEIYFEVVKLNDSAGKKLIGYFQSNAVEGFVKI